MEALLVVTWVAAFGVLSALALPLAARLFPRFPDRGASLALPLALAVVGLTTFWVGHLSLTVAPFVGVAALAASAALAHRFGRPVAVDWRAVGEVAAVFLVAFGYLLLTRAVTPGAVPAGGEKFLDYGLLKTLLEAPALPAEDFWFSGEPFRYYYTGQLVAAALARLTWTGAEYAYNLALAGFYAALVTAVYGVAGALVDSVAAGSGTASDAARERARAPGGRLRAVAVGFVGTYAAVPAAVLRVVEAVGESVVAVASWVGRRVAPTLARRVGDGVSSTVGSSGGYPEGSLRADVAARAAGSTRRRTAVIGAVLVGFAGTFATPVRLALGLLPGDLTYRFGRAFVAGIRAPYEDALAQTSLETFSLWYARYVVPGVLNTFPHWAFYHGDLHAHQLSTPFLVTVVGVCLAYYRTPPANRRRRWGLLAVVGVLAGLLGLVNLWSMPTALGLAALTVAFAPGHPLDLVGRDAPGRWWLSELARPLAAGLAVAPLVALGVAVGSPFFLFHMPYSRGVGFLPPRSQFVPLLLAYGAFVALFAVRYLPALRRPVATRVSHVGAAGLGLGALGIAAALVGTPSWAGVALLVAVVALGYGAARALALRSDGRDAGQFHDFVPVLVVGGAGLLLVTELAYARIWPFDPDAPRWNTVYKVSMQVWVLWGIAAAGVLGRFLARSRSLPSGRVLTARRRGLLVRGSVAAIVLLSATFGLIAANARVGDAFYDRVETDDGDVRFVAHDPPELTLDATRYIEIHRPDAARAIDWLDAKPGRPVVATEAGRGLYQWQNAPATFAGTPTLAGWKHEIGYRSRPVYERRATDVDAIYTGSWRNASRALAEHDVRYVWVGTGERDRYGENISFDGLRGVTLARDFGTVQVYAVDQSALAVRDDARKRRSTRTVNEALADRYCDEPPDERPDWTDSLCDE